MRLKVFTTLHENDQLEKMFNKWIERLEAKDKTVDVFEMKFHMNTVWTQDHEKLITKYALVVLYAVN